MRARGRAPNDGQVVGAGDELGDELDHVRWQLDRMVTQRLLAPFTAAERRRYDELAEREAELLCRALWERHSGTQTITRHSRADGPCCSRAPVVITLVSRCSGSPRDEVLGFRNA